MSKRITKVEKTLAFDMGQQAFEKGIKCAPCADKNFMQAFIAKSEKVGDGIAAMKAWTAGWTAANISAIY